MSKDTAQQSVHWTLGSPSAHALGVGDVRLRLTRLICGFFEYFSGFEFFLLPSRVHARPSAMLRERKPLGELMGNPGLCN
jgi:hypothetical protein